jgi:hypothetical protein
MRYPEFENILSEARINRYLSACNGNTKKAMTLYRQNLRVSQELFTMIGCFEVALRNAIDVHCGMLYGNNWLREGVSQDGIFSRDSCRITAACIKEAIRKIGDQCTHTKLVAEFGFGFWRYFFAGNNYNATGRCLLNVFPARPSSTKFNQFNHRFIFNQLATINNLRNRIAHHEPICFEPGYPIKSSAYSRQQYELIAKLFSWMCIDKSSFLYGLDHILDICNKIDAL